MLRLINVCKSYKFGKNRECVLDNINIDFKKNELVFILGTSGSGKSTLLNIIGGMLEVDSGSVMLDDKDITKFSNKMLCNYRNNMVGFIFQDYHLIEYMSVIDNIRLGETIKSENNNYEDVLRKLGIYSKRKSLVNRLSGGEKQRVAIARAIINNPEIILCDEPTGALDCANSDKIMKILKDISKDKLVIVVSHDEGLALKYADRVINIKDGMVDYYPQLDDREFREIKNKKISLFSIIKLAIKNLGLKMGRTIFTSIAVSIGLICMILVLCLSKSFNDDIDKLEGEIVSSFPIRIYNGEFEIVDNLDNKIDDSSFINNRIIRKNRDDYVHTNKIDLGYMDYVNDMDGVSYVGYEYDISMPFISDRYKMIDNNYIKNVINDSFVMNNYDILYGRWINSIYDIVLKVDDNNRVDSEILDSFLIDGDVSYEDIIGRKIRVIVNDLYYVKNGNYYYINSDYEELYNNSEIELEIVGVVREKNVVDNNSYIYYSDDLIDYMLDINKNSEIVLEQINREDNVLGIDMDRYELLSFLGYETLPFGMNIYVKNVDDKKLVLDKLDQYNDDSNVDMVYVDTMDDAINILKSVIDVITVVLVIFSMIAIFVSSLMIFILTNNRVMERKKEIGILRSLGARGKDVMRLFNIENMIIGIISFVIGIVVVRVLNSPINMIMGELLDDDGVFKIYNDLVIVSGIFNIFIVVVSGYIPSMVASKRGIVDCIQGRV